MKIDAYDQLVALLRAPSIFSASQAPFDLFDTEVSQGEMEGIKQHPIEVPNRLVFGRKMEFLLGHWLKFSSRFDLSHSQIQIFKDKITLGELDFLLHDYDEKKDIHLELVCKFYIYFPNENEQILSPWIGPNRKDSLLQKLNKLRQKQLPILWEESCKKSLMNMGWDLEKTKQKVCFKAFLFTPYQEKVPLQGISEKAIKGFWISWKKFPSEKFKSAKFALPLKENWMVDPSLNDSWMSIVAFCEQIEQKINDQHSPLCWMLNKDGSYQRFFIVWW